MNPTTPVTLRADELGRMISSYVEVGYSMAVKRFEPKADMLRKKDVEQWLSVHERSLFRVYTKSGRIVAHKNGMGKNSPLYYSKCEILKQLALSSLDGIGAKLTLQD